MKKDIWVLIVAMVIWGISNGCTGPQKTVVEEGLTPKVVASPAVIKLDKKATVTFLATGLPPGQEFNVITVTADGIKTDITSSLDPDPIANDQGAWISVWKDCGRFISRKLIKEGVYTITVTDGEYNPLAHVPVAFYSEKAKKKK